MHVAVCDDEKKILEYLSERIKEAFELQKFAASIDSFQDSAVFLKQLQNTTYDVIFLDIDMPGINGFDIGEYLVSCAHESIILFVSNKEETVYESLKFRPFRFIRKNCFEQEIDEAVKALIVELCSSKDHIVLSNGNRQIRIAPNRIRYVESNNKTLKIVSQTDTIELRYRMMDIEEKLRGYGFIRIHKGYLVNYRYISSIKNVGNNYEIVLETGENLPVSRNRANQVFEEFGRLVSC